MKFINFLILTGLIALTRLCDVKQLINVDLENFQLDENFIDIIIVLCESPGRATENKMKLFRSIWERLSGDTWSGRNNPYTQLRIGWSEWKTWKSLNFILNWNPKSIFLDTCEGKSCCSGINHVYYIISVPSAYVRLCPSPQHSTITFGS